MRIRLRQWLVCAGLAGRVSSMLPFAISNWWFDDFFIPHAAGLWWIPITILSSKLEFHDPAAQHCLF